jgi:hypothetical protein
VKTGGCSNNNTTFLSYYILHPQDYSADAMPPCILWQAVQYRAIFDPAPDLERFVLGSGKLTYYFDL